MSSKDSFNQLRQWLSSQVIGQSQLIERLMIALLADGHLLVEGARGVRREAAAAEGRARGGEAAAA